MQPLRSEDLKTLIDNQGSGTSGGGGGDSRSSAVTSSRFAGASESVSNDAADDPAAVGTADHVDSSRGAGKEAVAAAADAAAVSAEVRRSYHALPQHLFD